MIETSILVMLVVLGIGAIQCRDQGNIDRITGHMDTTLVMSDPTQHHDPITATIHYDMVCKASSN